MPPQTGTTRPQSGTFTSQNLELNYLDWGNESAPPLLLLHGMWDHARSWDWVAERLCSDYRVLAMDLRGHGDSQWSPDGAYLPAYHLLDFAAFVDALGLESFSLVAHSYGGNPSARYAAIYPERVRKLVLVDAMGPNKGVLKLWASQSTIDRSREWLEKRQAIPSAQKRLSSIEDGCARLKKANKLLTDAQARHLVENGVRADGNGYRWKYDPLIGNFAIEDYSVQLSEFWRGIRCPTLLCWGPHSWTTNPAEDGASEYFEDVQCITFPESGHWLHHNQLDDFVQAVTTFLRK